jgi:hypothetical protein
VIQAMQFKDDDQLTKPALITWFKEGVEYVVLWFRFLHVAVSLAHPTTLSWRGSGPWSGWLINHFATPPQKKQQ